MYYLNIYIGQYQDFLKYIALSDDMTRMDYDDMVLLHLKTKITRV